MARQPETGLPMPPEWTPSQFNMPAAPTRNPDPTYRTRLLATYNDAAREFMARRTCFHKTRKQLVDEMKELRQIAAEAESALIKDGAVLRRGAKRTRRRGRKTRK